MSETMVWEYLIFVPTFIFEMGSDPQMERIEHSLLEHGDGHCHPPPNASGDDDGVAASCIEVTELVLVVRAVHQL
jgi:hypothetical protein